MRRTLPACLILLAAVLPASADNWPQWRGPKNDGHSAEKGLPTEFGPEKNVVWKLAMPGQGESTPCVWGDRMFFTSSTGDSVVLLCVGTDGKEKWRYKMSDDGSNSLGPDKATEASASCSTDGKHVWSYVGGKKSGRLTCHDFDGKLVWERNVQDYGKFNIQFGTHWTPVLYKDRLYLQVMHRTMPQLIVALDKATGKDVWKVERKGDGVKGTESEDVYASAFIWEGEGGPLLISHGNDTTTAHRLDDGAEVWRLANLNTTNERAWRFVSSPLISPDLIVIPTCKQGPTIGINPVGAKGTIAPDSKAELWRFKTTPDVVSPIRVGDIVYMMGNGPLTAVDAKTGKQIYYEKRPNQLHRSNMVAADGKLYIVGREGTVDVVQAGPGFKLLAANKLPDQFNATPAIADGRIYLRGWKHLWAIGTK